MKTTTETVNGNEVTYIESQDILRKIVVGKVFDFSRKTKQWILIPEMSLS